MVQGGLECLSTDIVEKYVPLVRTSGCNLAVKVALFVINDGVETRDFG